MKKNNLSLNGFILRSFFENPELYLSSNTLAEKAGVSTATIWKQIDQLKKLGYSIESQPHRGYCLSSAPDIFYSDELLARLPLPTNKDIMWNPLFLEEATSTNDLAWQQAQKEVKEGLVIVAEKQTKGRGRQGRSWESTSDGGIYCSILLRPQWPPSQLTRLTIMTSVAIAEAIENLSGKEIQIKWPNDLLINKRKFVGILTEIQTDPESIRFAVIGFGINVNQSSKDFSSTLQSRATSLKIETKRDWRRMDVLLTVLQSLQKYYHYPFHKTVEKWKDRCLSLGEMLTVQTPIGAKHGQAMGLNENGALLLRLDSGQVEKIMAGDIVKAG